MTNIFEVENIKEDTKKYFFLFSEKSDTEIMDYCFNNPFLSSNEYNNLFLTACTFGNEKVVQNYLTKEYTEGRAMSSVKLDFLFKTDGILMAIKQKKFSIIDIIFNHLKNRQTSKLSNLHTYSSETELYIFSIFKKMIKYKCFYLFDNQYDFYNSLKIKNKIELLKYSVYKGNLEIFEFLLNNNKKSDLFNQNFDLLFNLLFVPNQEKKFQLFINTFNFSIENNFNYFIEKAFFNWQKEYTINYLMNNKYFQDNFTFEIFKTYINDIKFIDPKLILKFLSLKNIKPHINIEFIKENFINDNTQQTIISAVKVSNF